MSDASSESSTVNIRFGTHAARMAQTRNFVVGVAGVAIGICIVFISTLLAFGPHGLDKTLHEALRYFFTIALPLFALALLLIFLYQATWPAYFVVSLANGALWLGIQDVLAHLDSVAVNVFTIVTALAILLVVVGGVARIVEYQRGSASINKKVTS